MIEAVAFCPQAPALVPAVGRGLDAELGELRAACAAAVASVRGTGTPPGILASGSTTRAFDPDVRGSFAGFGVDLTVALGDATSPFELPAALCVGAWLTAGAGRAYTVSSATPPDLTPGTTTLLVLGDGSARRTDKAPGYLDDRAAGYDDAVGAALASGDPAQLAALDVELGHALLAAGASVWSTLPALLEGSYRSELLYAGAPFGVGYFVATWTASTR